MEYVIYMVLEDGKEDFFKVSGKTPLECLRKIVKKLEKYKTKLVRAIDIS